MSKRKFLIEDMEEWTDAEVAFVHMCKERNWYVDNEEETGVPVLYPIRAKDKGIYTVGVHGGDKKSVLMYLCITAKHGKTKTALLDKANRANLGGTLKIDTDTDAYYVFPINRLARAVKTFNLRRKQNHKGPPKEAIKRGQAALEKWRKENKNE